MSAPIPAIAIVDKYGNVRSLIRGREPDVHITKEQVSDASWLARLLTRVARDLAQMARVFAPRRLDFQDVDVVGDNATEYRFVHGFNGRVNWWPICAVNGFAELRQSTSTDNMTLVLISASVCTVSIRIEEAG